MCLGSALPIIKPLWASNTHTFANNPSQALLLKFSVCSSCWFDRKWWSLFFRVEEVRFFLLLARFLFLFLICSVIAGRQRKGTSLTSSLMGKKERDKKRPRNRGIKERDRQEQRRGRRQRRQMSHKEFNPAKLLQSCKSLILSRAHRYSLVLCICVSGICFYEVLQH